MIQTPSNSLFPDVPLLADPATTGYLQELNSFLNQFAQTFTSPSIPTGFTATVNGTIVLLAWNAAGNCSQYRVLRNSTGEFATAQPIQMVSASKTGIRTYTAQDGVGTPTTRYYWIQGVNERGITGPQSAMVTVGDAAFEVGTADLADGAVTNPKIFAGAVSADKITVTELSAISADMGSLTAGTVTGATIRTSSGNPRVQMDSLGFHAYDNAGTEKTRILHSNGTGYIETEQLVALAANLYLSDATASYKLVLSDIRADFFGHGASVARISNEAGAPVLDLQTTSSAPIFTMDGNTVISAGRAFVGSGGVNTAGDIETSATYKMDASTVINTSAAFVGAGGMAATLLTGTIADARLSANVPLLDAATNTFSGDITVSGNDIRSNNLFSNGATLSLIGGGSTEAVVVTSASGGSIALFVASASRVALTSSLFALASGVGMQFGTHSAIGAETVTGYITITDAGGITRKLAVVS